MTISIAFQVYLTKQGILPLGTVRSNRVRNIKIPKEVGTWPRYRKSSGSNVKLSLISWFANKVVNICML